MKRKNNSKVTVNKSVTKSAEKNDSSVKSFLNSHIDLIGYIITGLSFVMALILFNPDVSVGGDDSMYLETAYKFANGVSFPTWQGPVYPMLLGVLIKIFGFSIIGFKFLSVLFFSASVYFIYKIFVRYGNAFSAVCASLFSAVSLMLLNYASSTYTEPFFMFLQSGMLYYLLRIEDWENDWKKQKTINKKNVVICYSILALIVYTMFQTRSLAVVLLPLVAAYLLIGKRYFQAAIYGGAVVVYHLINALYRKLFWNVESVSFVKQLDSILLKNPYDIAAGYETFGGFFKRLVDNSVLYLSKHTMKLFGILDYHSTVINPPLTVVLVIILVGLGFYIWKHNKKLFVLYSYILVMMIVTFVMLQKLWDQERLVMIYFPILVGLIFYFLNTFFKDGKLKFLPYGISAILFLMILTQTFKTGNLDISDNFDRGSYNTYTDDWKNYMSASKWASENLPENSVVLCRKPQMSWVASDGNEKIKFNGIYRLYSQNADSMRNYLVDTLGGSYVILANLRLNPYVLNGKTITTVRYSLRALTQKYPRSLKLVKQFGTREPTYLFMIDTTSREEENLFSTVIVTPENALVWRDIILSKYNKKQFSEGVKLADEALKFMKNDLDISLITFMKGVCYIGDKAYEKSIECFDQCIKLTPKNYDAYFNKAVVMYNLGRNQEALQYADKALEIGSPANSVNDLKSEIIRSMSK